MPTAWDTKVFSRAATAAAVVLVLAWLVSAATDEGGISWGVRAGRTLPLVPLCAAIGAWIGLAAARARGEVRALEALGSTPARIGAPAVSGATSLVLVAAIAVAAVPSIGVEGFYPSVPHAQGFHLQDGALVDDAGALRVGADGVPSRVDPPKPVRAVDLRAVPAQGRGAAVAVILLAGLALPLLVARSWKERRWLAFVAAAVAILATLVVMQAAAAHRLSVWWAIAPQAMLLAVAAWRYRAES